MNTRRGIICAATSATLICAAPSVRGVCKDIPDHSAKIRASTPAREDRCAAEARRGLACISEIERLWAVHEREFERLAVLLGEDRLRAEWETPTHRTHVLIQLADRIDELGHEQERIAHFLATHAALSPAGAVGKILLARELIDPREDAYDTRALLERAAADFASFGVIV